MEGKGQGELVRGGVRQKGWDIIGSEEGGRGEGGRGIRMITTQ